MDNRIREFRTSLGWSQAALAERLGVSRQTVNALEAGRWDPSLPLALDAAALFGTTVETLFCAERRRQPTPLARKQ